PVRGVFSAVGLLFSRVEVNETQTCIGSLSGLDPHRIEELRASLRSKAAARLKGAGFAPGDMHFEEHADLRYAGQTYELTVPAPEGPYGRAAVAALEQAFGDHHMRAYGHRGRGQAIELVTWRTSARGGRGGGDRFMQPAPGQPTRATGKRMAYFGGDWGMCDAVTMEPAHLLQRPRSGPVIIEEYDATTIVPPGWSATLHPSGAMIISLADGKGTTS